MQTTRKIMARLQRQRKVLLLGALALGLFLAAAAPLIWPFDIAWSTVDGGGGTSSGGTYMLSGTLGQPENGTSSGGSYTVSGGFWVWETSSVNAIFLPAVQR